MNAYDYYLKHFRDELGFTQSQSVKANCSEYSHRKRCF